MIFADDVLAVADQTQHLAKLAPEIEAATKYRLDHTAIRACRQVFVAKPTSLLSAMRFCRSPFPKIWVEWPFRAGQEAGHYTAPAKGPLISPKSTAMLLDLDEAGQAGLISLLWDDQEQAGVRMSPLAVSVDWSKDNSPEFSIEEIRREMRDHPDRFDPSRLRYIDDDEQLLAMNAYSIHYQLCINPALRGTATGAKMKCITEEQVEILLQDWTGELGFIQAFLILLNSKNCVDVEEVEVGRLNRARSKRGKRPVQEHRTVKLQLDKRRQARMARRGLSRSEMEEQLVSGHYKVRKTGVFWWGWHRRYAGDGEAPTPEYRVVG